MFRTLLGALLLTAAAVGQTIQLADGALLLAKVEEANGDGLRVKRLDNGGVLELRWDQLSPGSALAIKKKWALAGDDQDEVLARAEEVIYYVDGQKQSLIGRIVDRTNTHNVLVARGVVYRIPIKDIGQVRTIEVPVGQVYTKDEWYALRLAQLEDPENADQNMLMAEELIRVRDYEHAGVHLGKAKELGNSRDPQRLESLSTLLDRYKEAAKERELLDQIIACRSRGTLREFEKGLELIARYETEFPASRLKDEYDFEKKRFEDQRRSFYSKQVSDYLRRSIHTVANKVAGEPGITLQAVRDYAENQMSDELFERTAKQYRIEVEEARQLWADRGQFRGGKRTEHFSYGVGSWVLGEQNVLKDSDVEARKNKQKGEQSGDATSNREIERMQRILREAMRRRASSQGGAGQQKEETEEDWWQAAARAERASWLRAYYAEYGGQLVVTYVTASACVSCFAKGSTPEIGPDGKLIQKKCFLCHGTKWMRSFKAY